MMEENKNLEVYNQFGEEWKKQISKLSKKQLIEILANSLTENLEHLILLEEITERLIYIEKPDIDDLKIRLNNIKKGK